MLFCERGLIEGVVDGLIGADDRLPYDGSEDTPQEGANPEYPADDNRTE